MSVLGVYTTPYPHRGRDTHVGTHVRRQLHSVPWLFIPFSFFF